jgi:two-component system, OmpR family, response regulator MprA
VTNEQPTPRVLVVDDDRAVRESLRRSLEFNGYQVTLASDGAEALASIAGAGPDALVIDVMMPRLDGIETTRALRTAGNDLPILVLTARDSVGDRVEGLDAGADDYLPKPFALPELLARVRALTRRQGEGSSAGAAIRAGDVTLDPVRHVVRRGDERIDLTAKEFSLLATLMQRPGQVFSRSVLLDTVWGVPGEVSTSVVELYVSYLRRKLDREEEPSRIRTVRGVGYTFEPRQ